MHRPHDKRAMWASGIRGFAPSCAAWLCLSWAAFASSAQTTSEAGPAQSPSRSEAETWLAKDMFELTFSSGSLVYQVYPKAGYTTMTGWSHDCAVTGFMRSPKQIPTGFTVDSDGKLTLEFKMDEGCPRFKYVFSGRKGDIYLLDKSGRWNLRELKVEIKS